MYFHGQGPVFQPLLKLMSWYLIYLYRSKNCTLSKQCDDTEILIAAKHMHSYFFIVCQHSFTLAILTTYISYPS